MTNNSKYAPIHTTVGGSPAALIFRHPLRTLLLITALLMGSVGAKAADYVFMYKDGSTFHILSNTSNTITDVTTFSLTNCVWSGTSGNAFSNQGRYLYWQNSNQPWQASTTGDDLTINRNKIYNTYRGNNYYIRYDNNSWVASTTDSQNQVVYQFSTQASASLSTPTISGNETIEPSASTTYTATASYSPTLYKLSPNNSGTTYYAVDGGTPTTSSTAPSTIDGITYSWSFEDNTTDNGHVRINSNTGELSYYSAYYTDQSINIEVTATANGLTKTASKTVTLKADTRTLTAPTAITANDATVAKGSSLTYTDFTLSVDDPATQRPYSYVQAESDNESIATITNQAGSVTINGIEKGTATITITAYGTNNATQACSTTFTVTVTDPQTGISGGVVTLNDYEDHTWTYYSGVDASVDGGNYNTNYAGKLYSPNPRNVKITYKGNGGTVSISEPETQFIYYKTLEQGTTEGQYPYTVISNPFSKRPTGKGFGGWKIISGGEYINGYSDNQTLPLDADIVFVNLPYPSINCTSAEIEFEATWVDLNNIVRRTNTGDYTYSTTGGTYETNILVIQRNQTGTITASSPVTIMMVEPDGSADYRGSYTFTGNITHSNTGVTKIEHAKWQPSAAIDARGKNFTIGRGVNTSGGTTRAVYATNQTSEMNQVLKIESGTYASYISYNAKSTTITKHNVTFGNDYDRAKGVNTNLNITGEMRLFKTSVGVEGAAGKQLAVMTAKSGQFTTALTHSSAQASANCFYLWDANSSNTTLGYRKLEIQGGEFWNIGGGMDKSNSTDRVTLDIRVKGGTIHGAIYGGGATYDARGHRVFVFTGGNMESWIAPGANGIVTSGTSLLYGETFVYIGGNANVSSNGSNTPIDNSTGGNVFGAGCGYNASSTRGRVEQGSNVVLADRAYIERGLYGGGAYGLCATDKTANIYITGGRIGGVKDTEFGVQGGVYGGARQNNGGTVNIFMTGGQIENGGIYGGSNDTGTLYGSVTMNINGGQVGTTSQTANIHGGGYGSATRVSGNVDVTLGAAGQTTDGVTVYGDVYGGSALGHVNGTAVTANYKTNVTLNKGTINGSLYGGGLGNASTEANVYGPVQVTVNGGSVTEGVFGCNDLNGRPQSTVRVDIKGSDEAAEGAYAINAVYGGGNEAAYTGSPVVNVSGGKSKDVFGGGLGATAIVTGATHVTQTGGTTGRIFGGGSEANVTGNVTIDIQGGTVDKEVYGGGALAHTHTANIATSNGVTTVNLTGGTVNDVYGGGLGDASTEAYVYGNTTVTLDGSVVTGNIFGCNNVKGTPMGHAKVWVKKTVGYAGHDVTDGKNDNTIAKTGTVYEVAAVYGGGNQAAYEPTSDTDYAEVVIDGCDLSSIEYVYGGGNAASTPATQVTINGCYEIGNVFGGGNGKDKIKVDGVEKDNPGANVGYKADGTTSYGDGTAKVIIDGGTIHYSFGGSNTLGNVRVSAEVDIDEKMDADDKPLCKLEVDGVYGGGNEAYMEGDASIVLGCVTSMREIFGGAKDADVGSNIVLNITSGHFDRVFGGNNQGGRILGSITVNIEETGCYPITIGELYGSGNEAAYSVYGYKSGGTDSNGKTIWQPRLTTDDEGDKPANEEKRYADPEINIKSFTSIGRVFGGGLGKTATVVGSPTVNINEIVGDADKKPLVDYSGLSRTLTNNDGTTDTVTLPDHMAGKIGAIGKVYGGGNAGQVVGNTQVNIGTAATVSYVSGTDHAAKTVVGADIRGNVFGGGLGATAVVTGSTDVKVGR